MLPILLSALDTPEEKDFFSRFYHKYKTDLYRYALSLLQDQTLAEEAVQEGWMKCVKNAGVFFQIPPEKRKAWMVVLVKNVCLDIRRKESRHQPLDPDWDMEAPAQGEPLGILDTIRAMPDQYRTILELKFVLEWKDKEIARHLGLPLTTVTTRISRGRKLLQDALRKEGYVP
ncbi:MAG: RNA polymerase sigma factor [Ruminiclostridium sp.]|nr:RNA polymerase sigma factor [Ruminiclostridium sp.]MBQ9932797.1 RNA polymerase sigma factor [Ruminiclostridium sp.]